MQVSEFYREELRAIYRARVADSFRSARWCLVKAIWARQNGDQVGRRKWLNYARIFWQAGAGWRERAETVAP